MRKLVSPYLDKNSFYFAFNFILPEYRILYSKSLFSQNFKALCLIEFYTNYIGKSEVHLPLKVKSWIFFLSGIFKFIPGKFTNISSAEFSTCSFQHFVGPLSIKI